MARLLVLGGSWFLGRAVVEEALDRGWEVTTFRRGQTGYDVPGVTTIRGDRTNPDDLARLAAGGPWDAAVDTSSFVPRETLAVAKALEPVVGRYVLISTVSVYEGWPVEPLTEESRVLDCPSDAGPDFGFDGDPGPSVYGFTKAGCERAVTEVFGHDRTVLLRPGVILGPYEYVGRLPWWLHRVARGGRVLAPRGHRRSPREVRRTTEALLRYVLRFGRSTPFGLFAGVAPVTIGDSTEVRVGDRHRVVACPDNRWLRQVIQRLEGCPELLARLKVVFHDAVEECGDRLALAEAEVVSIRNTPAVASVRRLAGTPVRFPVLAEALTAEYPAAGDPTTMLLSLERVS
ncbi:nucleoside-diphosphate-sugar epimerase, partial [Prauserella sp. Am3]